MRAHRRALLGKGATTDADLVALRQRLRPQPIAEKDRQTREQFERDVALFRSIEAQERRGDVLGLLDAHAQYAQLLERPGTHPKLVAACLWQLIPLTGTLRSLDRERFSAAAQIGYAEALVRLRPRDAAALMNLSKFYTNVGRSEEALRAAKTAIGLNPGLVGGWAMLARCYLQLGGREQANQCLAQDRQVSVTSDHDRLNYAIACLQTGNYADGWQSFRNRFAGAPELRLPVDDLIARYPCWTGEPMSGRLLLHSYGGAGDAFMLSRWIPVVRERVGALTVAVSDGLVTFMAEQFEDVEVQVWGDHRRASTPVFDAWCESFALPAVCGCSRPEDVPPAPYLRATAARDPLPGGFKVGVAWAGNPGNPEDAVRSTRLADWAPVFGVPGVTFHSLQVGQNPASKQLAGAGLPIHDLGTELRDWRDTAAALMELDLVIAVDCSVAHLAGALGRPVWICLPAAHEWRWMLERSDTPWYGSARLFRQPRVGDWGTVFAAVATKLRQLVSAI
jgi:tetratricopeptide (TPR) repeat protein